MEAQSIAKLRKLIETFKTWDNSIYSCEGEFGVLGCCDCLKTSNTTSYHTVSMYLPLTKYTQWWLDNWIKILPQIEERIDISNNCIILKPNTGRRWHQHHFIWTILRASYNNDLGYRVYNSKTDRFLEALRFFLFVTSNIGRFITETNYFNINIEKARKVFDEDCFKRMYGVFSGNVNVDADYNILKDVRGFDNRLDALNKYLKPVDDISDKDLSGINLFINNNINYRLKEYRNNKLNFSSLSGIYKNFSEKDLIPKKEYKEIIAVL